MTILDSNGSPLGVVSENGDDGNYVPENMVVIGGLIRKLTSKPEFTFQVIIPFKKLTMYVKSPNIFTRFINHTAAYAYGISRMGYTPEEMGNPTNISTVLKELSDKFDMSLSEPLAVDYIIKDTTDTVKLEEEIMEEQAEVVEEQENKDVTIN